MTLILDTHYKYDTYGRYYYLTPTGAELITGLDDLDAEWKNVERRLKSQGRILKSIMSYCVNNDYRPQRSKQDYIEYAQYSDTNVRKVVLNLLAEFAEWAYDVDGDRMVYEERNPKDIINHLPITMKIEGEKYGLLSLGEHQFVVPDDEYQVGY